MKKFLSLILFIILCFSLTLIFVSCDEEIPNDDGSTAGNENIENPTDSSYEAFEFTLNDGGNSYSVTKYIGNSKNVTVPGEYNGKTVTDIESRAFSGCVGITDINISDGIINIGSGAFNKCSDLKSITIPNSVNTVGQVAFHLCTQLSEINVSDNTVFLGGSYSFEKTAFYKNESNWKNGALYLGSNLIRVSDTVSGKYEIQNGTKNILGGAFYNCSGITEITLPDSVTNIERNIFNGCTGLTSIIVDANNKKYISAGNCIIETATKTLVVGCKASIIPNDGSVTSIGEAAFEDCSELTSITIPKSVTNISYYAFIRCTKLTSINFEGTTEQWKTIYKDFSWNEDTGEYIVHCTDGDLTKAES